MAEDLFVQQTQELASLALDEAKLILQYGPSQQKIQIIRSVLGVLAKQAAAGQDAVAQEMRGKLERLMADMRSVPALDRVVTDDDIIDVEVVEDSEIKVPR